MVDASRKISPRTAIAGTCGMDTAELSDCRYKSTRTSRAIYSVGDQYFAAGAKPPTDKVGGPWREHPDQFWAKRANTVVWVCDMETELSPAQLSRQQLDKVYTVLVTVAGASESERASFLHYVVNQRAHKLSIEWRFRGNLGFGGKYKEESGHARIDCYPEDLNAVREKIIADVNAQSTHSS
jgi:hypothetical protein